jgi:hypothetical protein
MGLVQTNRSLGQRATIVNGSGSAYTAGTPVVINGRIVIPETDIANGASGTVAIANQSCKGPAKTTDTGDLGTVWYWDAGNSRFTTSSTGNTRAGIGAIKKINTDTTVEFLLNAY